MTKCWKFELESENKKITTFVYSDTGKDIQNRFYKGFKVSNVREIKDPLVSDKKDKK